MNDCKHCEEGCSLPSSNNEMKILLRQLKREVKDLLKNYNLKELEQNSKIAETCVYIKNNLSNYLRDMFDSMKLSGEIDDIVTSAISNEIELLQLKTNFIVNIKEFGAVGDGICNDINAIELAIKSLKPGQVLYFPEGTYLMEGRPISIETEHITFKGDGLILCDYGFRPKASYFKAIGLRMEASKYSQDNRAFMIDNSTPQGEDPTYIEGFVFRDCEFKNFFYSVYACGGSYNYDGTEEAYGYPVRDVVIDNCFSSTYKELNAGHFQCIQVENISYINNRTYGGKNASSYNAIKGNGYIRVIGNYDNYNSYASCEIENGSGRAVISNNTFGAKIWIDDSFDTIVNSNTTDESILVTVGSNNGDANNVIISNNNCKTIRCEQFGNYQGGKIKNVNIIGNNVKGDNTHGIWIHGNAVENAKVCNNFISGTNTNDIAVQRSDGLVCYIHNNFGNNKNLLIAGSGGKVFTVDNYNINNSGTRDSLPASHLEREFNGLKVIDTNDIAWRVNVNTSGEIYTTKY